MNKDNEFYVLRSDIEKELHYYDLSGLVVHCPYDDPQQSEFFKYLRDNFHDLGLSKLIATYSGNSTMYVYDGQLIEQSMDNNGNFSATIPVIQSDIIITSPPFSLFGEFIDLLTTHRKQFLCVGTLNSVVQYKNIFPLIKEGKVWLGVNFGTFLFRVPDTYDQYNVLTGEQGNKLVKFGNIVWYTNYRSNYSRPYLPLTTGDITAYRRYDTYNAIDVSRVREIPNLSARIGVPITFLQYHNPDQFEIICELNHGCDNRYDHARPIINKKELPPRIIIKKKQTMTEGDF